MDLRYIKKGRATQNPQQNAVRSDVASFLQSIYESVAECLPDCRDNEFDNIDPDSVPEVGSMDPYCVQLNLEIEKQDAEQQPKVYRGLTQQLEKVKKPRKKRKGVELNMDRTTGATAQEVKYLPPGKMKEYYTQYKVTSLLPTPASFPTFWRAAGTFQGFNLYFSLVFRENRL